MKRSIQILIIIMNIALSFFLLVHPGTSHAMGDNPAPTVTVIDEETGKPIEGAVAIAIWRKHSFIEGSWFEGGKDVVTRIEEAVSDSRGNIYIDDYWNWHFFKDRYPYLNIYKPGYVCWDPIVIYLDELHGAQRKDFDKNHRIARMRKWPKGFSFVGHDTFVGNATRRWEDVPKGYSRQLFDKTFDYEAPFLRKEQDEINKKMKKEMEQERQRRSKVQ